MGKFLTYDISIIVKGIVEISDRGRRGRGVFIRIMPPGPAQIVVADLVIDPLTPRPKKSSA